VQALPTDAIPASSGYVYVGYEFKGFHQYENAKAADRNNNN
jgi:hypothetical protein